MSDSQVIPEAAPSIKLILKSNCVNYNLTILNVSIVPHFFYDIKSSQLVSKNDKFL